MELKQLDNTTIQSATNLINTLRDIGINKDLDVPSTVVTGDTSSGKSSVMRRLTGLPFPSGTGIKTTFVTEVVMQRDNNQEWIKAEVLSTAEDGEVKISQPQREISIDDFEKTIQDTAKLLEKESSGPQTLYSGVLRIEIRGRHQPPLTVIDLPGLMHSKKRGVSAKDVKLSADLIKSYIRRPRTVILAVASAGNEVVNQAIIDMAGSVDKAGKRTMGILTKLDTVCDVDKEEDLQELLQNKIVPLKLGWHGLVNVMQQDKSASLDKIAEAESAFFAQERFVRIDPAHTGIETFRQRVTQIVGHKLIEAIPAVEEDAKRILKEAKDELAGLGEPRLKLQEQRDFLIRITKKFEKILESQLNADGAALQAYSTGATNLRTAIDKLQDNFANTMRSHACTLEIVTNSYGRFSQANVGVPSRDAGADACRTLTTSEGIAWVLSKQASLGGSSCPGIAKNSLALHLFQGLSSRWEGLARQHIKSVHSACEGAMTTMLAQATGETQDAVARIKSRWLADHLKDRREEAEKQIEDAWSYIAGVLSASEATLETTANKYFTEMTSAQPTLLASLSLSQVVALIALAGARAYYNKQIEHWVREINDRIATHFVSSLKPAITAHRAVSASNREVSELVSEPKEQVEKRKSLEKKIDRLENALKEIERHRSMMEADAGGVKDEDE